MTVNLLTPSRMRCFKTCRRKHYYRYVLGVRPSVAAGALRIGTAVHQGLAARAKGVTIEGAIDDATDTFARSGGDAHDTEVVRSLLVGYFWFWERPEIDGTIRIAEWVEVEKAYSLPILNPQTGSKMRSWRSAGKRDGIAVMGDGRRAVIEHKTTSDSIDPDSTYWRRLEHDEQISDYLVASRNDGTNAETIIYDVIRKPDFSPKQVPVLDADGLKIVLDAAGQRVVKKDGEPRQTGDTALGYTLQTRAETPAEFGQRILNDITERPGAYFVRREIPRLEADLREYMAERAQVTKDIGVAVRSGSHYRNSTACVGFGVCEYLSVCSRGFPTSEPLPDGYVRVDDIHGELAQ